MMNMSGGLRPEERFSNLERIGRGSFGAVYRCTDVLSRDTVAVKIIDLEQAEDEIDDIQQVRELRGAPLRQRLHGSSLPGREGVAPRRSRMGAPVPSERPESDLRRALLAAVAGDRRHVSVRLAVRDTLLRIVRLRHQALDRHGVRGRRLRPGALHTRTLTLTLKRGRWVLPSQQPRSTHHLAWLGRANPDPNPPACPSHVPRRR